MEKSVCFKKCCTMSKNQTASWFESSVFQWWNKLSGKVAQYRKTFVLIYFRDKYIKTSAGCEPMTSCMGTSYPNPNSRKTCKYFPRSKFFRSLRAKILGRNSRWSWEKESLFRCKEFWNSLKSKKVSSRFSFVVKTNVKKDWRKATTIVLFYFIKRRQKRRPSGQN